jgi:serine/threonine-protein kinase
VTGTQEVPGSAPRPRKGYEPGELVGEKFRLIRPHGRGGMGTVWVAHNLVLDVAVAIKLIDLQGGQDSEGLAQRLLEEARAAAKLGHAAIVRVQDFGLTRRGDPFLAMELLDGEDLADVLERDEKLEPASAVQLLLPIANGLWIAHERGIVHRDVKPENIFVARDVEVAVQPKLLDFGIARMLNNPRKLTVEGSVLGTPDYMAPEQARGELPGPPADQWSFCVVLYELITGRCPFVGQNYNALLRAIIEQPPLPLMALGIRDERLWSIIERGLRKRPQERWPSMRELGEQLAFWLLDQGIGEDITGTSLQRTWLRDPDSSGKIDISTLARLPSDPRTHTGSGLLRDASSLTGQGPVVTDAGPPPPSGPDLAAIADIGDPVEVMQRAERRRTWGLVLGLTIVVVVAAVALLVGTGILVL